MRYYTKNLLISMKLGDFVKDDKGNLIKVTFFESYLSKYLIEHPEYFIDVYQKILNFIQQMEQLNQHNPAVERTLFSIFSILRYDYPHSSLTDLKEQFDLVAVNSFIKLFCDCILNNQALDLTFPEQADNNVLINAGFFKEKAPSPIPKRRHSQILAQLRVPLLFELTSRGVNATDAELVETRKLGITALECTPKDLSCYFARNYEPSQFLYTPDRTSNVGKWFARHNLPIISGTSGSICDDLALALAFLNLTQEEIRILFLGRAATLVAKGHHSFFESMILLNESGLRLQSTKTLYEFYEQTIPQSIINSESFQDFKKSSQGMVLLEGINDDLDHDDQCEHLLTVSIG